MNTSRTLRAVLALSLLALVASPASGAAASSSRVSLTASQQAGFRALQREIDATVARTGGRQTAVNEVSSADGTVVLTLAVPAGAEALSGAPVGSVRGATAVRPAASTARASGYVFACPYNSSSTTGRWLCLYSAADMNGTAEGSSVLRSGRMLKFQDAGYQALHKWNFENQPSSAVNTTTYTWTVYDWLGGNPNCAAGDTRGQTLTLSARGSSTVSRNYYSLGFADNVVDCIKR